MKNDPQKEQEAGNPFGAAESAERVDPEIPAQLLILPMRDVGLFPGITEPLSVGREASVRLIEEAFAGDKLVGLVAQRNPAEDKPQPAGLYSVGVVARLHGAQRLADGTLRVLAHGLQRIRVLAYVQEEPYFRARVEPVKDVEETSKETESLQVYLVQQFSKLVTHIPRSCQANCW